MRVGVIRGDLPGPVFVADLEPTSQTNYPTEPAGQTRYVSRPDPTTLTNYLSGLNADGLSNGLGGVPAGVESVGALTFPVTIVAANNDHLRVKTSAAAVYTQVTVAAAAYATMAVLVTAVNAALTAGGVAATATQDSTGTLLVIESKTPGVGSYISIDTTANGSTFNGATAGNFGAGGLTFTMPAATTIITALLPVGGPLDVSAATLTTNLGASPAAAAVANLIAPKFVETDVLLKSFEKGNLAGLLSASFTPDPTRLPKITPGAAITVVQDDGVSAFTSPVPNITGAVHNTPNAGDLTITGVGLGNSEFINETVIHITDPTTGTYVKAFQKVIAATLTGGTQGVVSATSIVIPASLIGGTTGYGSKVGNKVQVQFTSLASNIFTTT